MNNYISLNDFINRQISGDWGNNILKDKYDYEVYCIRGTDINEVNDGNYKDLPIRYIDSKNKTKLLKEGNIIIEISGGSTNQSTGRVCYVKNIYNNIICSNFCRAYEIKEEYSSKYFFYLIKNIYNSNIFFNFESKTTGIKNLLIEDAFKNIKVPKNSLITQKKIAKVLSDIDAKIELNNKINLEFEIMIKTIYEYWFVQFDFPNEEGKPYKSSGGKMIYNNKLKKEIPEDWEVYTLEKWFEINKNGDWGKETQEGNNKIRVSCIRGADINGLNGYESLKPPTRYILENNTGNILENNDIIIEISGGSTNQSTGRMGFITDETLKRFENPIICSNFCKVLTLKDEKYIFNFVCLWNRIYENNILFGWEGKTSGIKNLLFDSFVANYKEVYPNSKIVEKFYNIIKPIHSQKQKNLMQNQQLSELRDWLLPMLMNGQVTVKENGV